MEGNGYEGRQTYIYSIMVFKGIHCLFQQQEHNLFGISVLTYLVLVS